MTTTSLTLLDFYKAIEQTSSLMLEAAHVHDWDEVVRLEGACAMLIEQLRSRSNGVQLSLEERAEKHRIMTAILRHDAQIRDLAEPWIDEIGERVHPQGHVSLH